jgi:hypothetical protein
MKTRRLYLTSCVSCGGTTSKTYATGHNGLCKPCREGHDRETKGSRIPTRNERLLEHGYQAYAREEGYYG